MLHGSNVGADETRDYRVYEAGHDKLKEHDASDPITYKPFPEYNSPDWSARWHGEHVA
jgi:hypothetical protein